jgi:hypothetical protein
MGREWPSGPGPSDLWWVILKALLWVMVACAVVYILTAALYSTG